MSAFETYETYEGPYETQEAFEGPYESGEGPFETGGYETYEGEDEQFLGNILGAVAQPLAQAGMSALQSGLGGLFGESESPLSEAQEMEFATELMEIANEEELEQFLGNLFNGVSKAVGGFIKSPVGKQLGGILKGVAKKALPIVGGALGSFVAPGAGTAIGSQLGSLASNLFEMETEGMTPEQAQFEVARRYVRLASTAAATAARAPRNAPPARVTRVAITQAARQHAPGLLRGTTAGTGPQRRVGQPQQPQRPGPAPVGQRPPRSRRPVGYVGSPTYVYGNGSDQASDPGWGQPASSAVSQWGQAEPAYGAQPTHAYGRARTGRWVRRGTKIVLFGV
jgi:hypothetical protein